MRNSISINCSRKNPKPVAQLYYELLTLGDELLLGLTANGHLTFVGAQLGRRGVTLRRNITITDEADAIVAQFRESWSRADVVITTGGLGPTCDDRTRECIAEVLGQKLVRNAEVEETGLGAGVLNQPARGVAWLANRLSLYGQRIEAGQIVLSGSFIRPIEARHGDTILADFGPMGTVGCFFA